MTTLMGGGFNAFGGYYVSHLPPEAGNGDKKEKPRALPGNPPRRSHGEVFSAVVGNATLKAVPGEKSNSYNFGAMPCFSPSWGNVEQLRFGRQCHASSHAEESLIFTV